MNAAEPEKRRDAEDAESRRVSWPKQEAAIALREQAVFSPHGSAAFASRRLFYRPATASFRLKGLR
jgi:hypothetical protein